MQALCVSVGRGCANGSSRSCRTFGVLSFMTLGLILGQSENTLINTVQTTLKYLYLQEKTFNGCIFILSIFCPLMGFYNRLNPKV